MKPLQIEGSPDEEDLVRVQNRIIKFDISPLRVIRNGYLEWNADLDKSSGVRRAMDPNITNSQVGSCTTPTS